MLTKEERDNLARCIQKLLRATYASPDPDGLMGKLRTALDGLMALAIVATVSVETTAGVKRPASETDEDLDGMSVMFNLIVLNHDDTGSIQTIAYYLFID